MLRMVEFLLVGGHTALEVNDVGRSFARGQVMRLEADEICAMWPGQGAGLGVWTDGVDTAAKLNGLRHRRGGFDRVVLGLLVVPTFRRFVELAGQTPKGERLGIPS